MYSVDINPDYRWIKTLARVSKGRIIVSKRTMAKGCWGVLPLHIHRGKINTYLIFFMAGIIDRSQGISRVFGGGRDMS